MTLFRRVLTALFCFLPSVLSAQEDTARFGAGGTTLDIRSTTDIAIIRPVIERFVEKNTDLTVVYEQWGSNALFEDSRAACTGDRTPADAVFSSAAHHMVWLVNAACAHRYQSPSTSALPETRRWRNELWGITQEPAVIIYNERELRGADIPRTRFALLDLMRNGSSDLRGRIATYDIDASGLGYLFAYADSLEATTFGAMLEGFSRIDAVATCCSADIIEGVAEGQYAIAYNVLGSYVGAAAHPDVGMILPEDYTLVLSRSYMIPRGARQADAAERLLDFLLSAEARDILADIGLMLSTDPDQHGLFPSARRSIPLSPTLLVALDRDKRAGLFDLWDTAFELAPSP